MCLPRVRSPVLVWSKGDDMHTFEAGRFARALTPGGGRPGAPGRGGAGLVMTKTCSQWSKGGLGGWLRGETSSLKLLSNLATAADVGVRPPA